MAIMPFSATNGVATTRFFSDTLSQAVQVWSEEFSRASAAVLRYEELRIAPAAHPAVARPRRQARQVFVDLYDGR